MTVDTAGWTQEQLESRGEALIDHAYTLRVDARRAELDAEDLPSTGSAGDKKFMLESRAKRLYTRAQELTQQALDWHERALLMEQRQ